MIEYLFALSGLIIIIAIIRGPTFADRALAMGVLANVAIIFLLLYTIMTGGQFYTDIAIAIIFMSFVGSLAVARYARRNYA